VKASLEQKFIRVFKQIQLSSQLCFIPLPAALFHDTICTFRAQNNKSNDLYLLVMARCKRENAILNKTNAWNLSAVCSAPWAGNTVVFTVVIA